MEDGLNDGVLKSGNDTSYTRLPVTELPSACSSDSERVLQPINTSTLSNATMVDGAPMTEERFTDIYSLVLQRCATHPMHTSPTCQVCKSYEAEKSRIKATHHELIKQPCGIHTHTHTQFPLHVQNVYYGLGMVVI